MIGFYPKYCHMCCNARVCSELDDDNDASSIVLSSYDDIHLHLASGDGRPVRFEIYRWNEKIKENQLVGLYEPKHCPGCGRKLDEYKNTLN